MPAEGDFCAPSQTGKDDDGFRFELSPDGSLRATYHPYERRNNEWWETVCISWEASGEHLVSAPTNHEARIIWTGSRNFALFSGEAFGVSEVRVDIDVGGERGRIAATGKEFGLKRVEREIEAAYWAHIRTLPATAAMQASQPQKKAPRKPVDWKATIGGILIAIGIVSAIALASWAWHKDITPEPPYPPAPKMKPVDIN